MDTDIQKPQSHVFITGAYRSGTTLLQHLLDGHSALATFPVENCIFRDYLFADRLPNPRARSLRHLGPLMERRDFQGVLDVVFSNEKLDLPLHERTPLSGSMGDQVIYRPFDREKFARLFPEFLADLSREEAGLEIEDVFDAYNAAFFEALGFTDVGRKKYLVNKCPEKGCCIDCYLTRFPTARIIHIVRDPRAVIASHKAGLPKRALFPHKRFFQHVDIAHDAMSIMHDYGDCNRVLFMKYENLVQNIEVEMRRVAEFLDIAFDECLLQPTILGEDWTSNTSFSSGRTSSASVYTGNVSKYTAKLNELELWYTEAVCEDAMEQLGYALTKPAGNIEELRRRYKIRSITSLRTHWFRGKRNLVRTLSAR